MRPNRRQIILEVVEYTASGGFLIYTTRSELLAPSIDPTVVLLLGFAWFQYFWSIVNTVGWWTWLNGKSEAKI